MPCNEECEDLSGASPAHSGKGKKLVYVTMGRVTKRKIRFGNIIDDQSGYRVSGISTVKKKPGGEARMPRVHVPRSMFQLWSKPQSR